MKQTSNYQLPQWETTDRIMMEDFNGAMEKIDAALDSMPKIFIGTYEGDGTYGEDHPNVLTFPFPPKLVYLQQAEDCRLAIVFYPEETSATCDYGSDIATEYLTWERKKLSWYATVDAGRQMNGRSTTYRYVAVG